LHSINDLRNETELPAVIADQRGIITFVNERFEQIFGWKSKEIIGELLTCIVPTGMHDAHNLGFSRFLTTGQPTLLGQPLTLKAVNKQGQEFEAEHHIIAEKQDEQWVAGATIRPLDEQV